MGFEESLQLYRLGTYGVCIVTCTNACFSCAYVGACAAFCSAGSQMDARNCAAPAKLPGRPLAVLSRLAEAVTK